VRDSLPSDAGRQVGSILLPDATAIASSAIVYAGLHTISRTTTGLLDAVQHRLPGQGAGPKWHNKLYINAELTPTDVYHGPEMKLYEAILKQYGGSTVTGGVGSFSQMGFLDAEMAVSALQKVKGAYTLKSVPDALNGLTNYKTEMLCKPFTFGNYSEHIPNNTDYTVTPSSSGGTMVVAQGCTPISSADPQIAAYHKIAGS
jgi:branched-chain amino acid transport system substrate-binding protein